MFSLLGRHFPRPLWPSYPDLKNRRAIGGNRLCCHAEIIRERQLLSAGKRIPHRHIERGHCHANEALRSQKAESMPQIRCDLRRDRSRSNTVGVRF
jgi:hypothetical protein